MIPDSITNAVYFSPLLGKKYPQFFERLSVTMEKHGIQPKLLPETKDIWAVDYMPIQLEKDEFVQFKYDPSYLRYKKYENKKSYGALIADKLGKKVTTADIILDGGNVVKWGDKVIMTTRIFSENHPKYEFDELISELKEVLNIDKLILIPEQPHDFTGHSDGMVRFIDKDTVLINDNTKEKNKAFDKCLRATLHNAGLKTVVLPTSMYDKQKHSDATGDYMNFLQMEGVIFMPAFGQGMDKEAEMVLRKCFPDTDVVPVKCNELAQEGGILNCISWNVLE